MQIGVLGAGTWGVALARMLHNDGKKVVVWSALENEVENLSKSRVHPNLLGMKIPKGIEFTTDIKKACSGKTIILFAVPSVFLRDTVKKAAPYINDGQIIVDVAKGIESDTMLTMSGVILDQLKALDDKKSVKVVALSGPTHAEEVALDMPTTIVSACEDLKVAKTVQDIFMNENFRVYTNSDILGVELAGSLKNIIALASGMASGLGYGDNARAALITRGAKEIADLGKAMGANEKTFSGLSGVGDLIVTATSVHSRNNRAGMLMGKGVSCAEAIKLVGMVVEGVNAVPAAKKLAEKYKVELPIVNAVDAVIKGNLDPKDAVRDLMTRDKKAEF